MLGTRLSSFEEKVCLPPPSLNPIILALSTRSFTSFSFDSIDYQVYDLDRSQQKRATRSAEKVRLTPAIGYASRSLLLLPSTCHRRASLCVYANAFAAVDFLEEGQSCPQRQVRGGHETISLP